MYLKSYQGFNKKKAIESRQAHPDVLYCRGLYYQSLDLVYLFVDCLSFPCLGWVEGMNAWDYTRTVQYSTVVPVLHRHCNRTAFALLCWAARMMGKEGDNSLPRHRSGGVGLVVEITVLFTVCFGLVWFALMQYSYSLALSFRAPPSSHSFIFNKKSPRASSTIWRKSSAPRI